MNHIYGRLDGTYTDSINAPDTQNWATDATLLKIDQSEFIDYGFFAGSPGIRTRGWLYIPNNCMSKQCRLMVFLHGTSGDAVYFLDGAWLEFGPLAYANDLIVLLPQGDMGAPTESWENESGTFSGYTGTDAWSD